MKRFVLCLCPVVFLAACGTPEGNVLGAAALGAALDDDDPVRGAVLGAAVGVAGQGIQRAATTRRSPITAGAPLATGANLCTYRETRTGRTFQAAC